MATNATTARVRKWERAIKKYLDLELSFQTTHDFDQVERLGQAVAKQADELMSMRAPHLTGVLQKLYILWGEADLHGLDPASEEKRLILEDLERLIDDTAQLIVMHPDQQPVQTPGMWPSPAPSTAS